MKTIIALYLVVVIAIVLLIVYINASIDQSVTEAKADMTNRIQLQTYNPQETAEGIYETQ